MFFWRGQSYQAYVNTDGSIIIEATLGFEKVILQTVSSNEKTYVLGLDDVSKASYSNTFLEQFSIFSTDTNKGNGQIMITDFDVEKKIITGTFKFNARDSDESDTENPSVSFIEGVFYKVPVSYTSEAFE
ncbi:DUF6252 family protein [Flavobacterium sp. W22_SRS_FK3]|uniref:DUF6252 family protein n=1 Tax=Flavobacterium sp. W22_SRS_FK3 TaxID=3240275 RepID=UPI003F93BC03